nr:hypothetical protein [Tanacetum cinerariifolium]
FAIPRSALESRDPLEFASGHGLVAHECPRQPNAHALLHGAKGQGQLVEHRRVIGWRIVVAQAMKPLIPIQAMPGGRVEIIEAGFVHFIDGVNVNGDVRTSLVELDELGKQPELREGVGRQHRDGVGLMDVTNPCDALVHRGEHEVHRHEQFFACRGERNA